MRNSFMKTIRLLRLHACLLLSILIFTACSKIQEDDLDITDNLINEEIASNESEIEDIDSNENYQHERSHISRDESLELETSIIEASDIEDITETVIYYYVRGDGVRLREKASVNSDIITQLDRSTKVEFIDREGDWIKVKYDGETGYIRNDLLSYTEPQDLSASENEFTANQSTGEISKPKIIVKKSERVLELWDDDSLYGTYPIGLGWEPIGDKQKEGDGRTPEGIYYVCTRNNYSRFYLSLGVSYPNKDDAREALETGLIDQTTFEQIADAIDRKTVPPWNTPMGGEIMIHGHGSHSDWTAGCVAVDNDIMDILWDTCPLGTPIIIEP